MPFLVCLITVPSKNRALALAKKLVSGRVAACVNVMGGVVSHFYWKGSLETAKECLLVAKTTSERFEALKKMVARLHPYAVPEIIALPIVRGNRAYLNWIREVLR